MRDHRHWTRVPLCVVLAGLPLSAAASDWRPFGLQGVAVGRLAVTSARVCAATLQKGVFCLDRTAPDGVWEPRGLEGVALVALWADPARPDLMFAASDWVDSLGSQLFRTLDGGRIWERLNGNFPPGVAIGLIDALQGIPGTSTIYVAGSAVWRSDDLGTTWRRLFTDAWQYALEISPANPSSIWVGGELAYSFQQEAFLALTRNGGVDWEWVWAEAGIGFSDLAAHPQIDGLALIGLGNVMNRTDDDGATFTRVLAVSPGSNLLVDWSPAGRAIKPSLPPLGLAVVWNYTGVLDQPLTYVSRDLGKSWTPRPGDALRTLRLYDLEADERWPGVAFVGTSDGVHLLFGAGSTICHDARGGVDDAFVWPGDCPPILSPGPVRLGDVIAVERDMVRVAPDRVDLGAVHCLIEGADIAFATVEPPDPPPGEALFILAREEGTDGYGYSSDGLPRLATSGDCR